MAVEFSSFYDPIRFLIQDFDQDVPLIQDYVLDSAIRFVVNSGAIHGYAVGTDNESIIPYQSSSCGAPGYGYGCGGWGGWDNYAYQYGFGSFSFVYGNEYSFWFDQAFEFLINYVPQQGWDTAQDLTPMGNQEGWKRLVAECALWFVSGMVQQHFRTRSTAETISQPKDLMYKLEFYLDAMVNKGKMGRRPMPLPVVAMDTNAFFMGGWYGMGGFGGMADYGFGLGSF